MSKSLTEFIFQTKEGTGKWLKLTTAQRLTTSKIVMSETNSCKVAANKGNRNLMTKLHSFFPDWKRNEFFNFRKFRQY